MDCTGDEPPYRLAVRGDAVGWSWTLLQGEAVTMRGKALDVETACRAAHFAAAAHAALTRIGRRRF